jgi:hypothetical protein
LILARVNGSRRCYSEVRRCTQLSRSRIFSGSISARRQRSLVITLSASAEPCWRPTSHVRRHASGAGPLRRLLCRRLLWLWLRLRPWLWLRLRLWPWLRLPLWLWLRLRPWLWHRPRLWPWHPLRLSAAASALALASASGSTAGCSSGCRFGLFCSGWCSSGLGSRFCCRLGGGLGCGCGLGRCGFLFFFDGQIRFRCQGGQIHGDAFQPFGNGGDVGSTATVHGRSMKALTSRMDSGWRMIRMSDCRP